MVASGQQRAGRPAPLRLTRRGRVVVLMFLIIVTSTVGALLATASRASDPERSAPVVTTTVRPYDTLWSIASRSAPHRRPWVVVAEIRRLNDMPGTTVHPGETLTVPAAR